MHLRPLLAVVPLLAALTATTAHAQSVSVPYKGELQKDGRPLDGTVDLNFEAYNAAQNGTRVWSQELQDVPVASGKFSVTLSITQTALANAELHLTVSVRPHDSTGAYTPLAGTQRLLYVPYAARAEDFSVGNAVSFDARVGQKLNLYGNTYGIGVEPDTLFHRSNSLYRWYFGNNESMLLRLNGVTGGTGPELRLRGEAPQLQFNDTNSSTNYWLHANDNYLYVLVDTDDNETWDAPHPLRIDRRDAHFGGAVTIQGGKRLRAVEAVNRHCQANDCTASCPAGYTIQEAWGFHGASPLQNVDQSDWSCGRARSWLGSCIGNTSCTVNTGCGSSGIHLECWAE